MIEAITEIIFHVLFDVPKGKKLRSLIVWLAFYLALIFLMGLLIGFYVLIVMVWTLFKPLAIFLLLLLFALIVFIAVVLKSLYQLWKQKSEH